MLLQASYEVQVFTSDLKGAGTDANLALTLHGALGSSGALPLAAGAGSFERGKARLGAGVGVWGDSGPVLQLGRFSLGAVSCALEWHMPVPISNHTAWQVDTFLWPCPNPQP